MIGPNDELEVSSTSVDTTNNMTLPPKRTLSAYNYFFRSERARLLGIDVDVADVHTQKKRRHRKTHGQIGFRDMANQVGARWKALSDEDRAPFVAMFEADRARYKAEMKAWNRIQKQKKTDLLQQELEVKVKGTDPAGKLVSKLPDQTTLSNKHVVPSTTEEILDKALSIIKVEVDDVAPEEDSTAVRASQFCGFKRSLASLENSDFLNSALQILMPHANSAPPLQYNFNPSFYNKRFNEMENSFDYIEKELGEFMDENDALQINPVTPVIEDFSEFDFDQDFDLLFNQNCNTQQMKYPPIYPALST